MAHTNVPNHDHFVQFYENDAFLVEEVASFIGDGLKSGEAGIVIATREHRESLDLRLAAKSGPCVMLDAAETLAAFMVDGWPDEERFVQVVGAVISKAAAACNGRVRAFGEMVALLWESGQRDAAVRLEDLWNGLAKQHSFSLFCAYPMRAFRVSEDGRRLSAVCRAHTHVHPPETAPVPSNAGDIGRMVVELQHKTAALELEAGRRIAAEKAQAELQAQLDALCRKERRKDEFLAMLGHELRNPLGAIGGALELLALDEARAEKGRQIIGRQSALMQRMVDDLLDLSRMSSGKIELKREKLLLGGVLERAVEMARPLVDEKRHTLRVNVPDGALLVDADPMRLAQVVANLIHNAAKYTDPNGLIVVTAREDRGEVMVSVRDNGIGLDARLREQVFDLFVQGDDAEGRSGGGLGIGLCLVRRVVQLHGGTVYARSDGPGRGSEFVFRLPLASGPARRTSGRPRKILVVDDNADAAEALAECLRLMDHGVLTARDGASAIELALLESPDWVILDIGLPEMDGYELARRLRSMPQLSRTTFVALTGYSEEGDVARARQSGFDHHLAKPLDLPQLAALLEARPKRRTSGKRQPTISWQ
jgi:signal transduction histidine kinase/ActR/RegA family two-component response regulator